MLTFSINNKVYEKDKAKSVAKLIKSIKDSNRDSLSDAFFNVVERNTIGVNLSKLNALRTRNEKYDKRVKKCEDNLVTEEEFQQSTEGIINLIDPSNYEVEVQAKADTRYYIETFLDLREYIFFEKGIDLWRLLLLVFKRDVIAIQKFRMVLDDFKLDTFFKDFLSRAYYIQEVKEILGT